MKEERSTGKYYQIPEFIFFGNYFYGLCAVALSVEATLQQGFPLNGCWYFFLLFSATVLYYTYPYVRKSPFGNNSRTNWYTRKYKWVWRSQVIITVILLVALTLFLVYYRNALLNMPAIHWLWICVFPATAALYYGLSGKLNLRKTGWLKPFVIGFTWAGTVTVYPILFYSIVYKLEYRFGIVTGLLFLKNFMFIAVLCILFDIKDYASDYLSRLRTFVVKLGLRKTIFYIVLPLTFLGIVSFICYAVIHQFHVMKLLLNVIPFVLLLIAGLSLHHRRSLIYYLSVIDGLMLVKAVCGIIAIIYF
jgi:hypothetical protein